MFIVSNVSHNPLLLSDGTMLAAGKQRKLENVGQRDKDYRTNGWLAIIEEKEETSATAPPKQETVGGKTK